MMEIKRVEKEEIIQNNYPKMEQISNEKLKKSIPSNWKKLGITSFIMGIIIKGKVLAVNIEDIDIDEVRVEQLAGAIKTPSYSVIGIIQVISTIGILVGIFIILFNKFRNKKRNEKKKIKKGIKIFLIVCIILFILTKIYEFYRSII